MPHILGSSFLRLNQRPVVALTIPADAPSWRIDVNDATLAHFGGDRKQVKTSLVRYLHILGKGSNGEEAEAELEVPATEIRKHGFEKVAQAVSERSGREFSRQWWLDKGMKARLEFVQQFEAGMAQGGQVMVTPPGVIAVPVTPLQAEAALRRCRMELKAERPLPPQVLDSPPPGAKSDASTT